MSRIFFHKSKNIDKSIMGSSINHLKLKISLVSWLYSPSIQPIQSVHIMMDGAERPVQVKYVFQFIPIENISMDCTITHPSEHIDHLMRVRVHVVANYFCCTPESQKSTSVLVPDLAFLCYILVRAGHPEDPRFCKTLSDTQWHVCDAAPTWACPTCSCRGSNHFWFFE